MKLERSKMLRLMLLAVAGMLTLMPVTLMADGAETPEAAFEAGRVAAEAMDWRTLVALVAPSERPMMALQADMGVGMMVELWEGDGAAEAKEKYQQARKTYAVPEDVEGEKLQLDANTPQEVIDAHVEKRARSMYGDIDVVGYVSTLMGIMLASPMMEGQSLPYPAGPLTDVAFEGDRATGSAEGKTLSFLKEGGRWYLTADAME